MTEEEKENWRAIRFRIKDEGIHYCFTSYSDWEEIKDKEFHKMRMAYLDSAKALRKYVEEKARIAHDEE